MASRKKTEETTGKPKTKRTAALKKTKERIRVGGSELAQWLGVSLSAISNMRLNGRIEQGEDTLYDLQDSVLAYIAELKTRKEKREGTSIEQETSFWKLQNLKQKNRDWRIERDRLIASEIIKALSNAMQALKTTAANHKDVVEAIDGILSGLGNVDVDLLSMAIEGDADDEE